MLDAKEENRVILEGPISKFLNKHHKIVKRYVVLNKHAFFVYKDESMWRSLPDQPHVVIPLKEITSINLREFPANQMFRGRDSQFANGELAHVMEIALR